MLTKREAETVEQIIRTMTDCEYEILGGWLSIGTEGPLWEFIQRCKANRRAAGKQLRAFQGERRDSP